MSISHTPISAYRKSHFSADNGKGQQIDHDVYRNGEGAPVILIQELPGIGPETMRLADRLVEAGFEVVLPHLFGPLEQVSMLGNLGRVFCMRKEFSLFAKNKPSPIVNWLKALCNQVRDEKQVPGVGVIGMCLTGNFAISLMGDDSVLAAVAAQPSLPLGKQEYLQMTEAEVNAAKNRIDATAPMKAYRFEKDKACQAKKFDCIHEAMNSDGKTRVELKTLPGKGHSVLTLDFVDQEGHPTHQALQEVLAYFTQQLKTA